MQNRRHVQKGAGTARHELFVRAFEYMAEKDDVSPPYFFGVLVFGPAIGDDYKWFRSAIPILDCATGSAGHLGGFDLPFLGRDHFRPFIESKLKANPRLAAAADVQDVSTEDFVRAECECEFLEHFGIKAHEPSVVFLTAGSSWDCTLLRVRSDWWARLEAGNTLVRTLAEQFAADRVVALVESLGSDPSPDQWRRTFAEHCDSVGDALASAIGSSARGAKAGRSGAREIIRPAAPQGWIYLVEAEEMYDVRRSSLQDWTNHLPEVDRVKDNAGRVRVRVDCLEKILTDKGRL